MNEQNINEFNNVNAADTDEISLKQFIQKVKDWISYYKTKWKTIFLAGILGAAIGLIYAINQPITYKAVLTFALEDDQNGGSSGLGALVGNFGLDLGSSGGGAFAGSNLMELMKSRLLVEKTLLNPVVNNGDTISIAEYYIQINNLRENWSKNTEIKNIQYLPNADRSKFSLQQDSILQTFFNSLTGIKRLKISQKDKKVSITNIEVISESEKFAKVFCENLVKETSDFYIETKSKKSRLNVEILKKQTDSIREALNSAITGVASASDNVYNLNPAFNVKSSLSKSRQVEVQANTAILTQLVAQLEMSKVNLRKETPLIQIIDRPILPLEKNKVSKLNSIIVGGFLSGLLIVIYLFFLSLYKKMIA